MTRQELIDHCLAYFGAYEDYPFDDTTPVMKHSSNKKMFALIGSTNGNLSISLKCDPMKADFFRGIYQSVTPGYHFNKKHWNTIIVDGDVPIDELISMIEDSNDLIKPKIKRRKHDAQIYDMRGLTVGIKGFSYWTHGGFSRSSGRASEMIAAGLVSLNYESCIQPAKEDWDEQNYWKWGLSKKNRTFVRIGLFER